MGLRVSWSVVRTLAFIALVLLSLVYAPPAEAEGYEETEQRLKTAGIDADMREKIHAAIRRGVTRLRAQQWKRGNFPGSPGHTALAGLALRHAAIPNGLEGSHKAIAWMTKYAGKELREQTYAAGITALLLQADGSHPKYLRSIHDRLSKGPQSDRGYWGYRSAGGDPTPNLSTAQFACLGLWAAERAGAPPATRAWTDHLATLLVAQQYDGSWGYYAPSDPLHGRAASLGRSYPTGTFMGLANVVLAHRALEKTVAAEPEQHARILVARAKGLAALRRHVQWTLSAPRMPGLFGAFPLYRLYALEKVCIFMDVEDVGGIHWYREGAQWLLDTQQTDGGWTGITGSVHGAAGAASTKNPGDTSFALLFLLRASASYHPITPRPVDAGGPVTPRAADEDDPKAPPSKSGPPLEAAVQALDRIEDALDKRRRLTQPARLRDAFRLVRRTYRRSLDDGVFASRPHDTWGRRAESLLLEAAVRFTQAKANDRLLWQAVAFDALDTLATTHPRVGPLLMKRILGIQHDKTFRDDLQFGWYAAAMEALRRLRPPGLVPWLGERALSPEPEHWSRTSPALTALGGLSTTLGGSQRYGAARAIVTRLVPVLRRSQGSKAVRDLTRDIQIAVRRLAIGAKPADFPGLEEAVVPGSGSRLLAWWSKHSKPQDPLWSD